MEVTENALWVGDASCPEEGTRGAGLGKECAGNAFGTDLVGRWVATKGPGEGDCPGLGKG